MVTYVCRRQRRSLRGQYLSIHRHGAFVMIFGHADAFLWRMVLVGWCTTLGRNERTKNAFLFIICRVGIKAWRGLKRGARQINHFPHYLPRQLVGTGVPACLLAWLSAIRRSWGVGGWVCKRLDIILEREIRRMSILTYLPTYISFQKENDELLYVCMCVRESERWYARRRVGGRCRGGERPSDRVGKCLSIIHR